MLLDINNFIEKEKKLPKHYISREFFNYQLPKTPKLKDIETGEEYIKALQYYRKNSGITDEVILKAIVKMSCMKHKPTKKDLENQIRKIKKKKPIKKNLRDFVF